MKSVFPRIGLVTLVLLAGCDALWNAANRGSLERDFKALTGACGVTPNLSRCRMIGTSRDAACEFTATPEEVASLVRGLNLKTVEPESREEAFLLTIESSSAYSWPAKDAPGKAALERYASGRRPNELVLKNGTAFEYLILYYDPGTGRALARLSYAYG